MISRFGVEATRRFDLPVRVAAGSGHVLVGPGDRGIHAHCPFDTADRVGVGLQRGQQLSTRTTNSAPYVTGREAPPEQPGVLGGTGRRTVGTQISLLCVIGMPSMQGGDLAAGRALFETRPDSPSDPSPLRSQPPGIRCEVLVVQSGVEATGDPETPRAVVLDDPSRPRLIIRSALPSAAG